MMEKHNTNVMETLNREMQEALDNTKKSLLGKHRINTLKALIRVHERAEKDKDFVGSVAYLESLHSTYGIEIHVFCYHFSDGMVYFTTTDKDKGMNITWDNLWKYPNIVVSLLDFIKAA